MRVCEIFHYIYIFGKNIGKKKSTQLASVLSALKEKYFS